MQKAAWLFAGQGAQCPGMGKSLYETSAAARGIFDIADQTLGGISALCFEGTAEDLAKTRNTQLAVLTTDMAAYAALCERGFAPDAAAGFSLGEYAALVASGALTFAQALSIVQYRAQLMDEVKGGMTAVLGINSEAVEAMCAAVQTGVAEPVNYNCPGQTVVAGTVDGLEALEAVAKAQGVKTARLTVSCPSHSSLMRSVGEKLRERLKSERFSPMSIPLVANATGDWAAAEDLAGLMARQVMSPVRWEKSIRALLASGVTKFVEIGSGKTLSGFMKRIDRSAQVYNVQDTQSLEDTVNGLGD